MPGDSNRSESSSEQASQEKLFTPEDTKLAEFGLKMWQIVELSARFSNYKQNPRNPAEKDYYNDDAKAAVKDIQDHNIDRLQGLLKSISNFRYKHPITEREQSWLMGIQHHGATDGSSYMNEKESNKNSLSSIDEDGNRSLEQKAQAKQRVRNQHRDGMTVLAALKEFYDRVRNYRALLKKQKLFCNPSSKIPHGIYSFMKFTKTHAKSVKNLDI